MSGGYFYTTNRPGKSLKATKSIEDVYLVKNSKGRIKMDRKFLEEKGLEKEVIDEIMKEHGKTVQSAKPDEDYETLKSEKESLEGEITDLNNTISNMNDKYSDYEENVTNIDKLTSQIEDYKIKDIKNQVAIDKGIPLELANRLSGETEEDIKSDAETLSNFISQKKPTLPMGSTEPDEVKEKPYSNQARIIEEQYQSE